MQMKTNNKITTKPLVIVGIVLITILLFCLVGCNNNVDNTPPTPNPRMMFSGKHFGKKKLLVFSPFEIVIPAVYPPRLQSYIRF